MILLFQFCSMDFIHFPEKFIYWFFQIFYTLHVFFRVPFFCQSLHQLQWEIVLLFNSSPPSLLLTPPTHWAPSNHLVYDMNIDCSVKLLFNDPFIWAFICWATFWSVDLQGDPKGFFLLSMIQSWYLPLYVMYQYGQGKSPHFR